MTKRILEKQLNHVCVELLHTELTVHFQHFIIRSPIFLVGKKSYTVLCNKVYLGKCI